MPLYEYQCVKCHRKTEKIEALAGPHLRKCPHCGGKVEQAITAPSIQFKGSGWYVTDYAGKSPAKDTAGADTSSAEKSEKKESTSKESTAKESSEKKPAQKK